MIPRYPIPNNIEIFAAFYKKHLKKFAVFRLGREIFFMIWPMIHRLWFEGQRRIHSQSLDCRYISDFFDPKQNWVQVIFPAWDKELAGPKFIYPNDFKVISQPIVRMKMPEVLAIKFKDVKVMGTTNFIFQEQMLIVPDLYDSEKDLCTAEIERIIEINLNCSRAILYKKASEYRSVDKAVSLLNQCPGNYAHFLTEILPKYIAIENDDNFKGVPILIDAWIAPVFFEIINFYNESGREVIRVNKWELINVKELIFLTETSYVPADLRTSFKTGKLPVPESSHYKFSKNAFNLVREVTHKKIKLSKSPKKIFITRTPGTTGNGRHLVNVTELEKIAVDFGYVVVEPSHLSFQEQCEVFANASMVISPIGAALANLIMCSPGCKVLGLSPFYDNANYYYFSNFMETLGHDFSYLLGEQVAEKNKENSIINKDYKISAQLFKVALEKFDS